MISSVKEYLEDHVEDNQLVALFWCLPGSRPYIVFKGTKEQILNSSDSYVRDLLFDSFSIVKIIPIDGCNYLGINVK